MVDSAPPPKRPNRARLAGKLAVGMVFLAALAGTGVWVARQFFPPRERTVFLPVEKPREKPQPAAPPTAPRPSPPPAPIGPAIGGVVVDEAGKPVRHARISLNYQTGQSNQRVYRNTPARTDGDGQWTSTDVPAESLASLRLGITQPNYATLAAAAPPVEELLAHTARLTMSAGVDLSGIVVNDVGLPLIAARISAGRAGPGVPGATSGTNGKFTLHHLVSGTPVGVVATLPDFAAAGAIVTPAAGMAPLRISMSAGRTLTGRVTDLGGGVIGDVEVRVNNWLGTFRLIDLSATTDSQGRYQISHVPADMVQMAALKDGYIADYLQLPAGTAAATMDFEVSPQITIHGKVTDAGTNDLVARFTLITGVKWHLGGSVNFSRDTAQNFGNGRFRKTLSGYTGAIDEWYVRAEAPGYLPAVSAGIKQSGEVNIRLQRGSSLAGRILDKDGKPAQGVTVAVAGPNEQIEEDDGQWRNDAASCGTDAGGRFDLPAQTGDFILLAAGSGGMVMANPDELAKSKDLTLAPLCHVEGLLKIGKRVGANERVQLEWRQSPPPRGPQPRIVMRMNTQADASGHYSFDGVWPGAVRVGRTIETITATNLRSNYEQEVETENLPPGASATINLGGVGRPVAGKIHMPAGAAPEPTDLRRQVLMLGGPGVSTAAVDESGAFRFDDVRPGRYILDFSILPARGGRILARGQERFVMPEVPQGASEEPLVLPDFELKPVGQ